MVKVLVAPDKFKGSLQALEVCNAVAEFFDSRAGYQVVKTPLADGGEGTSEVLTEHFSGRTIEVEVHDPLMRKIKSSYGISDDGRKAFIELAQASGLQVLKPEERNPLYTTTYGTGELIRHAMKNNVREIILGIGGSATNDAGTGMASCLGYLFLDSSGKAITELIGKNLLDIASIDSSKVAPQLKQIKFTTLCDVTNPLSGVNGAAHVYGPQKGASADDVRLLDAGLVKLGELLMKRYGFAADFAGAGAAGGFGAGAKFFLGSEIVSGFDYLSSSIGLKEKIVDADLIITGEGKLDLQSLSGKVVKKVCELAKEEHKKIIVLCGKVELNQIELSQLGITECLVLSEGIAEENAIANAYDLIKQRLSASKLLKIL